MKGSTLDTTNGLVRIVLSSVTGTVNQIDPGLVNVNLQLINGRPVAIYNFSGTGSGIDSKPAAYRIATGSLDLGTLAASDPVRVRGFVVAYGQALTSDYNAQTVIDLSGVPAWLTVNWTTAVPNPFTSLTNQAMVTDIAGSALHDVFQRGVATDLASLAGSPTIQPDTANSDLFAIVRGHSIQLYGSFADFSNALTAQLTTHPVKAVGARGSWDSNTVTVTSRFAVVKLQ
jgi:hypothetical protein